MIELTSEEYYRMVKHDQEMKREAERLLNAKKARRYDMIELMDFDDVEEMFHRIKVSGITLGEFLDNNVGTETIQKVKFN